MDGYAVAHSDKWLYALFIVWCGAIKTMIWMMVVVASFASQHYIVLNIYHITQLAFYYNRDTPGKLFQVLFHLKYQREMCLYLNIQVLYRDMCDYKSFKEHILRLTKWRHSLIARTFTSCVSTQYLQKMYWFYSINTVLFEFLYKNVLF